jgi:glutaminase
MNPTLENLQLNRSIVGLLLLVFLAGPANSDPASPTGPEIVKALETAHARFADTTEGKNADYIPALAQVPSQLFGIVVVTADGQIYETGDSGDSFAIESISKLFTLAQVIDSIGPDGVQERIGVEPTGLPFNSVTAVEEEGHRGVNPFVNAGAMACVSLVKADSAQQRWDIVLGKMSDFAGRPLSVNEEVYASEAATNQHNRAIATLLQAYGTLYADPLSVTDTYTRQCSVSITTRDLALMGATLANGGVHPLTKVRAVKKENIHHILAIMATSGLYDGSGSWLYTVGLPAKSGVGGGIVAIVPGKLAIAAFSPPLDEHGNSVRAQKAIGLIVEELDLNLFR